MFHQTQVTTDWKEDTVPPFDELMVTWNAARPTDGKFLIYVSVKIDQWSPWLLYSSWGNDSQSSYHNKLQDAPIRVYQDALEVMDEQKATGFQIKISTEGNAELDAVYGLHVYTNSDKVSEPRQKGVYPTPISLKVEGLSQIALNHPRSMHLCSPTSTTAVVRFLSHNNQIDPVHFAQNVLDSGFDIYGNWVFNVAEAASVLGPTWNAWVERLEGFDQIYAHLEAGSPVIVSLRGPLSGGALPYANGHLLAVIGYDPEGQKVLCMDPAFPKDELTLVRYSLNDFVEAWNRRGRVAYMFSEAVR